MVGHSRNFKAESLFGRMSVAGIFFHVRPFLLRFSYPRSLAEFIYRGIKTISSRVTINLNRKRPLSNFKILLNFEILFAPRKAEGRYLARHAFVADVDFVFFADRPYDAKPDAEAALA